MNRALRAIMISVALGLGPLACESAPIATDLTLDVLVVHLSDDVGYPVTNAVLIGYAKLEHDPARQAIFSPLLSTFLPTGTGVDYEWLGVTDSRGRIVVNRKRAAECRFLALVGEGYATTRISHDEIEGPVVIDRGCTIAVASYSGLPEGHAFEIMKGLELIHRTTERSNSRLIYQGLPPGDYEWRVVPEAVRGSSFLGGRQGLLHLSPGTIKIIVLP